MRRLCGVLFGLTVLTLCGTPARADEVEYFHADAIGNVRAVTDESRNVVERHDYLPFGEEWCGTAICGSVTPGQPKRFTGKERDAETALDYFGARYYGSRWGRFTTVDPLLDSRAALVDPTRWNRYAYGQGNPLRFVDPDGRDGWDIVNGAANAFGSNSFAGAGRQQPTNEDYAAGQAVGDALSIPHAAAEVAAGLELGGIGIGGAPLSGGASLVLTATGAVVAAHGATAGVVAAANTGQYMAKKLSDLVGGGKTGRKLSKNRLAHQQEEIDRLTAERDAMRRKANKVPADQEAIAAKERELKRAKDRLRASEEHARKAQGSH